MTVRAPEQLPLELAHRPAFGRDDFLAAACNEAALAWIERWPHWDAKGLALAGPAGCGKSHLVALWCARADACLIPLPELAPLDYRREFGRWRAIAVDGIVDRLGEVAEVALLHLFNDVVERGGHVLLAARHPPAHWAVQLADLRSRLNTLPVAAIEAPDDAVLAAMLVKHCADRQLRIGRDDIAYLMPRIGRTFAAVARVVAAVDRTALAQQRAVSVPLLREVLTETDGAEA